MPPQKEEVSKCVHSRFSDMMLLIPHAQCSRLLRKKISVCGSSKHRILSVMKPLFAVALVLLAAGALVSAAKSGTDPQCSQQCTTNNDCMPSLQCSHCYHGVCIPGESCGSPCLDTTDCNQLSNCTLCTNNVCSAGCGQQCNTTAQCQSYGCDVCTGGTCQQLSCNRECKLDSDCVGPVATVCGQCDFLQEGQSGVCRSGCGSVCLVDTDCRARCPFCNGGLCSV